MKVKWKGTSEFLVLTHGKSYDVLSVEKGWYRIKEENDVFAVMAQWQSGCLVSSELRVKSF